MPSRVVAEIVTIAGTGSRRAARARTSVSETAHTSHSACVMMRSGRSARISGSSSAYRAAPVSWRARTCASMVAGAGQTEEWNHLDYASSRKQGGSIKAGAATSTTMAWTSGTAQFWALGGVAIKPKP